MASRDFHPVQHHVRFSRRPVILSFVSIIEELLFSSAFFLSSQVMDVVALVMDVLEFNLFDN